LLWALDEPEILLDKEIEITIALGVGLLILILDRRADRRIHEMIHEQHLLINKMHKKIDEQNELIKNIQEISSVLEMTSAIKRKSYDVGCPDYCNCCIHSHLL
jgi:hypothetical protein